MANLTETGPKPIDGPTYNRINTHCNKAKFFGPHCASEGLLYAYIPGYKSNVLFWSKTFFEYTKKGILPRIEKCPEGLSLVGQDGNATIKPRELRIVDPVSTASGYDGHLAEVTDSGYLLTNHVIEQYALRQHESEVYLKSQLEQLLADAEKGQKPPLLMENPFVKVSPQLAGKRLAVIFFEPLVGAKSPFFQDAVVINTETHKLVARKVVRPLSKARWGQIPRQSLLDQYPHGIPLDNEPFSLSGKPWYES